MIRLGIAVLAVALTGLSVAARAQWGVKFYYTCPAGERFVVTLSKDGKPHYCYDGQHFSEEDGGTVPEWVKEYFAAICRHMRETEEEIHRKGEEMKARWEQAKAETARMNEESARRSREFNDRVARRSGEIQAVTRGGAARPAAYSPVPTYTPLTTGVRPKVQELTGVSAAAAGRSRTPPPVSPEPVRTLQVGTTRDNVLQALGKPRASMSLPGDGGMQETLTYALQGGGNASIVLREGRVTQITLPN